MSQNHAVPSAPATAPNGDGAGHSCAQPSMSETAFEEFVRQTLTPFLPCNRADATNGDYLSAATVIFRAVPRDPAPDITGLIYETRINRLNTARTPPEAVIETLEYARDYLPNVQPEEANWLRTYARKFLSKRYSRDDVDRLIQTYLEPALPGEAPYDARGVLSSVDLSVQRSTSWLANGMIPEGTVGFWIAPYSTGKTFGAMSLGLAAAFGKEWMGQPVRQGHVRYIAAEGLNSFDRRIVGWMTHHGLLPEKFSRADLAAALAGKFDLSGGSIRLDDPRLEEVLTRTLLEQGTRLLVLDTLGRLLGTGQHEDDNAVANAVTGTMHRVAAATGCTILFVHHPGHTNTHRARGGSAWAQAADWVIVSKATEAGVKNGAPVRLINTKQRDAELFADLAYRLRTLHPVQCEGEDEPWSCALFEPTDVQFAEALTLRERIIADLHSYPGSSQREIRARVGGDNSEIRDEITRMLADGSLVNKGTSNRFSLHASEAAEEFSATVDLSDLETD
jgi:hypothetical protein